MFDIEPELGSLFDDVILQHEDDSCVPSMQKAGIDELTPTDTMIGANGDYIFVTEV